MRDADFKGVNTSVSTRENDNHPVQRSLSVQVNRRYESCHFLLDDVFRGIFVAVFEDTGPQFILSNYDDHVLDPRDNESLATKLFVRLLAACSDPPLGIHGPLSVPGHDTELEMISYTFKISSSGSTDMRILDAGYRTAVVYVLFRSAFKGFVFGYIPSISTAIRRIIQRVTGDKREFLLLQELEEALPYLMGLPRELSENFKGYVTKNIHSLLRESRTSFSEIRGDQETAEQSRLDILYALIDAGLPAVTTIVVARENGLKAIKPYFRDLTSSDRLDQLITTMTGHTTAAHNVNEALANLFRLQSSSMPPSEILDSLVYGGLERVWQPLENTILYSDDHVLFFTPLTVSWFGEQKRFTCCTQHKSCKIDQAFQAHFSIARAIKNVFISGS
ncbi:MAG: hypothetical protein ACFFD4_19590 [Candidatus Odinarchaeota archaeon]